MKTCETPSSVYQYFLLIHIYFMAVAVDTNLLVALRAIDLLLTPTPTRDHMLYCPVSILEGYHN